MIGNLIWRRAIDEIALYAYRGMCSPECWSNNANIQPLNRENAMVLRIIGKRILVSIKTYTI